MLATIGFTAAAVIFMVYGYSLSYIKDRVNRYNLFYFSIAYGLLGLACLIWALGALVGTDASLAVCVFVGNLAVLAATAAIINSVICDRYRLLISLLIMIAGIGLLAIRTLFMPAEPFLKDGVLVFNSQLLVALILAIIFVAIWMPINLKVSRAITSNIKTIPLKTMGEMIFIIASFSVVSFIIARKPITVALSFAILCCAFIPLTFINYLAYRDK